MKLSKVIEIAIRTEAYNLREEYMCLALDHMSQNEHIISVQALVRSIRPDAPISYPLVCALHDKGIINMSNMTFVEMFMYTKQLYCWWVFDLKRKGL